MNRRNFLRSAAIAIAGATAAPLVAKSARPDVFSYRCIGCGNMVVANPIEGHAFGHALRDAIPGTYGALCLWELRGYAVAEGADFPLDGFRYHVDRPAGEWKGLTVSEVDHARGIVTFDVSWAGGEWEGAL